MKKYTYTYDTAENSLLILENEKIRGYLKGPVAEQKLLRLLDTNKTIKFTNMAANAERNRLIRTFHACLAKQGIMQHKESILSAYGVESTTELTNEQLQELINKYTTSREVNSKADAEVSRLRSDILTILNKIGIYVKNSDWTAVNDFCIKHAKKTLYQMNVSDMIKARKQFNAIADYVIKKNNENKRIADNN